MRLLILIILFSLCAQSLISQVSIGNATLQRTFESFEYEEPEKRKVLDVSQMSTLNKINPITYVSAGAMFFYQRLISEQLYTNCIYTVSCSSNAKFSIQEEGLAIGVLYGAFQLSSCSNGVPGDYCYFVIERSNGSVNRKTIE
jgi:putative component of membrane protein insertase Oxa1/YidC/SpoIIIJ protein YidD